MGDTTILTKRSLYVEFTLPFIKSGVGLVVSIEDQVKRDSVPFLKPLSWELWLTSFVLFFLIGFTVWALEHRDNPDFHGPPNYQGSTILWFCLLYHGFCSKYIESSFPLYISAYIEVSIHQYITIIDAYS